MSKILRVALREFLATVATKAFIIGAFVVPALLIGVLALFPLLLNEKPPAVEGRLSVVDRSGAVTGGIRERLRPEAIAARRERSTDDAVKQAREAVGGMAAGIEQPLAQALGAVPRIEVEDLSPDADLEAEKDAMRDPDAQRLALVLVHEHAITRADPSAAFGGFELFVRSKLDDRVESEIRGAVRDAVRHERIVAAGLDPDELEVLTEVEAPRTTEITATGERTSLGELRQFVSFGFMAVLMISVMIGGQYLLTTTVEEKSSRVVEVLLSALSPMQLMTGKIVGQLGVGLTILAIYGSIGGGALILFGLADLLGLVNLLYLLLFFFIAYVTIGALMAAIGSAVNDMREAQSLQGPVMISLMLPYMLWFPISRDPSSAFATVTSFIPPINTFVMMLRLTSTEPPPTWQVLLSIAVGIAGVYGAVWAAAKIFRIGLLMFGKPPNLATLVRWVRQA